MARYFTSDLHFGHARIVELAYRPYATVEEMNEALIDNWNATVGPDDRVIIVGDMFMGHKDETLPIGRRLNGRKYLVPGNHDRCHPMDKRAEHFVGRYAREAGVATIGTEIATKIAGHDVTVCHFPFEGDHTDDERYVDLRPTDNGQPLIHGHVHGEWLARETDNGTPMLNVGVDVNDYRPIHEDEVALLLLGVA